MMQTAAVALAVALTMPALAACLDAAERSREQSLEASWSRELGMTSKGPSPVQRVVSLLKMKTELEKEAETESELYDKMVCWCETNEKEKTQAVKEAKARDLDLTAEVESRGARFGEISTQVDATKQQIAQDTEALEKATSLREKSAKGFRAEEKDMVQAMTNLKNAIAVLSRHQGAGFLQLSAPLVSGMRVVLRSAAIKYQSLLAGAHKRKGTSFLAISANSRASERAEAASGTGRALLSALDVTGSAVSQALDLRFAEQILEHSVRAARPARRAGGAFIQTQLRAPKDADYKSYNSRSGGILGILKTMLDEFEDKLSGMRKDDAKMAEDFAAMEKSKSAEIAVSKEKLDEFEGENAANQKALSDAKEDLELTRKQRAADIKFLRNLRAQCSNLDKEWEKRSATRSAEIQAVAETIAILTEDDNREMLAKSVSLMQEASRAAAVRARRSRAAAALRRAADDADDDFEADDLLAEWDGHKGLETSGGSASGARARLSTLAVAVKLDDFSKVKKMIDTMVANLKKKQAEDVKLKAYCTKEFNTNEKATYKKSGVKEDLEAKIKSLTVLVKNLGEEMEEAKSQMTDVKTEIKKASQDREAQNKEFQMTVADQRATRAILEKALARLKDFYSKGLGKKVLLQAEQTPPAQFNSYKTNAGASPVMGFIEQIAEDSAKLEAEATASERQAQADYQKFVKDSNALSDQLAKAFNVKKASKGAADQDIAEATGNLDSTNNELASLAKYEADLHGQCDWLLKNFDIRQKARTQEMEAIQSAKAILSGSQGK